MKELKTKALVKSITEVTDFINDYLEDHGCPMKTQMQIDIAVEEIFVNIANYAYNPEIGDATIRVEVSNEPLAVAITFLDHGKPYDPLAKEDPRYVDITFIDSGVPFNPLKIREPDVKLSLEERQIGGLGVFLVRKMMDDMQYEFKDGQNINRIRKYF